MSIDFTYVEIEFMKRWLKRNISLVRDFPGKDLFSQELYLHIEICEKILEKLENK